MTSSDADVSLADALDALKQIRKMANLHEGKKLPEFAVGAIEGYCNRIERVLKRHASQT